LADPGQRPGRIDAWNYRHQRASLGRAFSLEVVQMNRFVSLSLLAGLLPLAIAAPAAAQSEPADPVLISRGTAALSLSDLDARMQRFSDVERAIYARDASNLGRLMDRLPPKPASSAWTAIRRSPATSSWRRKRCWQPTG
jgi:hypothetical protein